MHLAGELCLPVVVLPRRSEVSPAVGRLRSGRDVDVEVLVGGMARDELMDRLAGAGVQVNVHAETLLGTSAFDSRPARPVVVTVRSLADLGLVDGAPLSVVFSTAMQRGLALCPLDTGPYLRLVLGDQAAAGDTVMSSGRAPTGSLTVASEPRWADHELPKGFYLRMVEGTPWLRGYRCDDQHVFAPDDRFVFSRPRGDR